MKYHREEYDIDALSPLWSDAQVVRRVRPGTRVLELGCASGYIGKFLKEKWGCKVWGFEADEESARAARPHYESVTTGDLNDPHALEKIQGPFDHILCMAVLEHLLDPGGVLRRLKALLKEDGTLMISLPNVAHWSVRFPLFFGNFNYRDYGVLDKTHVRFYTLRTARELIEGAGLEITHRSIDPDNGIPKFHGLLLRIPKAGPAFLEFFYKLWPGLFGYQLIFEARPLRSKP